MKVESKFGTTLTVGNDLNQYTPDNADVLLTANGHTILLTPKHARKLAKGLKRHARKIDDAQVEA